MADVVELGRAGIRQSRKLRGRFEVGRIEEDGSAVGAVACGIRAATRGIVSGEEQAWIARIEQRRSELLSSSEQLAIQDFGAGHSKDFGTEQAGQAVRHRSLGDMSKSSKPPQWAFLLFRLIREFKPSTCLEMGTCVGISASYQAAALELNGSGQLVSLEGSDVLAQHSRKTLELMGLDGRVDVRIGAFNDTLGAAVHDLSPLTWAFVDGHHDEAATWSYTERLLESVADEAVLVFDDINWSPGMKAVWDRIAADPRFALAVDMRSVGIAVVSKSAKTRQSVKVSYF